LSFDKKNTAGKLCRKMAGRNSRSGSISKGAENDAWTCKECDKVFSDPDARLLECQRCRDHVCIKCLKKTKDEYEVLTKSDSMWFCTPCKANVEENITTGLKIENMCDKIIQMFESRLNVIEQKIDTKCDESKVRDIVKDELAKAQDQITSYADATASESVKRVDKVEMTTVVVDEINERKKRENNIVIFGLQESESDEKKERGEHDLRQIKKMFIDSKVQLEGDAIKNYKRLGRYDSKKPSWPLLATLEHTNQKIILYPHS
jgi:hypothetical protein